MSFATRFVLATQFLYGSPLHAYHPTSFLRSPRPILDVTILLRVATPVRGLRGGTMRAIPRQRTDLREGDLVDPRTKMTPLETTSDAQMNREKWK